MLVLTRHVGEHIQIGPDVLITLVSTGNGIAKIGVTAPVELRVERVDKVDGELRIERVKAIRTFPS